MLEEGSLDPNDIGLLYVVGEETVSSGMTMANQLGITPAYLVVGEPTDLRLGLGHKGGLGFVAQSFGRESHSGYPWLGKSAITPLVSFMTDLETEPWPNDPFFGQTTMNIGQMCGGVAMNVVPANASISVMLRATVPAATLKARVLELAAPYNLTLTFSADFDPFRCDLVPGFEAQFFGFGTDLPAFHGKGHLSYLFGPGSILVAHTDGEYIDKGELARSIGETKRLVTAILAQR
jgi:acetylornithine deacetylase